jgi:hypothetical protein
MTAPEQPTGHDWCSELAATLTAAARRAGLLADRIAEDWGDVHGRERAGRTALLQRELGRSAVDAAELGRRLAPAAQEVPPVLATALAALHGAAHRAARSGAADMPGAHLGGTAGTRVDEDRGMRLPELPPSGSFG